MDRIDHEAGRRCHVRMIDDAERDRWAGFLAAWAQYKAGGFEITQAAAERLAKVWGLSETPRLASPAGGTVANTGHDLIHDIAHDVASDQGLALGELEAKSKLG